MAVRLSTPRTGRTLETLFVLMFLVRGSIVFEALGYKPEGRGFETPKRLQDPLLQEQIWHTSTQIENRIFSYRNIEQEKRPP
jgi:hypothetical protein